MTSDKTSKYILDKVRTDNPLTQYLAEKGYHPEHEYGDKCAYLCPLPGHTDTSPSFFVFTNGAYDNFYCWGCSAWGDVIEMHRRLNGLATRLDALKALGGKIEVDFEDEIEYSAHQLKSLEEQTREEVSQIPGKISIYMSCVMFSHFEGSDKDLEEIKFLEKLYKKIDQCIWQNDIATLMGIAEFVLNTRSVDVNGVRMTPMMYRGYLVEQRHKERLAARPE